MHDFDQSRQRPVPRRDEVHHLELGVVVGVLGHEVVIPTRRQRYGIQEVNTDELKPLRDLGLAQLVARWLLGALVDLSNVTRSQRVGEIYSHLGDCPFGLHGTLVWISQSLVPDVRPLPPLWHFAGIDGVAVEVAVGSPITVVGDAKNLVAVNAEATPMVPPQMKGVP